MLDVQYKSFMMDEVSGIWTPAPPTAPSGVGHRSQLGPGGGEARSKDQFVS